MLSPSMKKRLSYDDRYIHSSSSSFTNSIESGVSSNHRRSRLPQSFGLHDSLDYYDDEVDNTIIDHELVHRNRESLIRQLHTTEKAYVASLDLLVDLFIKPLKKDIERADARRSSFSGKGSTNPICTQREMLWLFCNLEDLHHFHHGVLMAVEQRLRIFGPTQIISDILKERIYDSLGKKYGTYLDRYNMVITTYSRMYQYAPFRKFVEAAQKDSRLNGATLLSLLQIPAGCVSTYAQIFIQLANGTEPNHPDYKGLCHVKKCIYGLYEEIRPKIDQADNIDQVWMLHQAFVNAPFQMQPNRRLILQGELTRVSPKPLSTKHYSLLGLDKLKNMTSDARKNEWLVILFSDILMYVEARQEAKRTVLVYKEHMSLQHAKVRTVPRSEVGLPYCFEVTSSFTGFDSLSATAVTSPRAHILQTKSDEEQEDWVYHLSIIITELTKDLEARTRQRTGSNQTDRSNTSHSSSS